MIEHLFGSKTRVKLLQLFARGPERTFFIRELTRILGVHLNAVRRELSHLKALGLIEIDEGEGKREKRKKFVRLNPASIIWDELRSLMAKSELLGREKLTRDIANLSGVDYLLLTGIFTGDAEAQTDMLCVGKIGKDDMMALMRRFEREFGREIRYTSMTRQEFMYRRNVADKFLSDLLSRKHLVVVDELQGMSRV